ncbi:hypothetical protein IQ06DRAFT_81910 [Phaeosphaeriaceae sp. SRC1lsM3a]|nr:hypothetical protein IQ06DRAFT_81910 [Stagonospora sp. SRC1lsM3a]
MGLLLIKTLKSKDATDVVGRLPPTWLPHSYVYKALQTSATRRNDVAIGVMMSLLVLNKFEYVH